MDSWATTPEDSALSQSIPREGKHHTRPRLLQKSPGHKPTAKLMLNSFWGKFGENLLKPSTETVHNASDLFAFKLGLQSLQRHTPSQNRQRRHSRGRLRQPQGQATWQRTRQHLCGRFHHLSRETQTIRVLGTTPTKSAILRHRLRHLHQRTWSTQHSSRRPCRWYDQQTGWRRLHHRIHLRWTQKLRLQNQPRQSLLQSQGIHTHCVKIAAN